ncbi:MAG: hypothetical protein BAJATHORv1_90092 [Candidatus Thorarchaeota archaeon]|nr:MAG: hypothetical protein BAJATHORv1_90092 [Candidatus Thorarchaeota archaeon]
MLALVREAFCDVASIAGKFVVGLFWFSAKLMLAYYKSVVTDSNV